MSEVCLHPSCRTVRASAPRLAVEELAEDVGVARVTRRFLEHVREHPAQIERRKARSIGAEILERAAATMESTRDHVDR